MTIILWTLAILFVCSKNKKLKVKFAAEKIEEERQRVEKEKARLQNLDLILGSFFFGNKDKNLPQIKNEAEANTLIDFAELCLEITCVKDYENLTHILRKVTALPLEHKELLSAVVVKRLSTLRNCSIESLYEIESV
jgi:hypothetical protein